MAYWHGTGKLVPPAVFAYEQITTTVFAFLNEHFLANLLKSSDLDLSYGMTMTEQNRCEG